MTDPQSRTDDSVEVEETSAGSFGDAASEMANETEVESEEAHEGSSVERQLA